MIGVVDSKYERVLLCVQWLVRGIFKGLEADKYMRRSECDGVSGRSAAGRK